MGKYLLSEKEYTKYQNLKSRVKELEEKLNAQFAEMEEKLTAEENKNFELKENIKTIFTSLIIANHVDIGAIQDTIWVNTFTTLWDYIRIVLNMDDNQFEEFEKQALQKINEVKQSRCENCKHHYTDYDCLHDYCNVNDEEISINDSCNRWESEVQNDK